MKRPLSLSLYRGISIVATPIVKNLLARRLKRGKEDPARLGERLGYAQTPRPNGRLIWLHAASVGETMSILPLIKRITALNQPVLLTTGTLTSARLAQTRLPSGAIHQFVPVDLARAVGRFLDHWQPNLAIFCESELWPNLIGLAQERGIPVGIVNGRMSARSYQGWAKAPALAKSLLAPLAFCLGQSKKDAAHFARLGAKAHSVGNLKFDGAALPFDPAQAEALRAQIGQRPLFLAASTHPMEEEIIIGVAAQLRAYIPDLLSVIVPRHPERGASLAQMMRAAGEDVAQRSQNEAITPTTTLYLADTLGELGLFYTLCDLAFLGGSLVPVGGHNPIEPARLHAPILTGAHLHNFTQMFDGFFAHGGAIKVADEAELVKEALRLLRDDDARNTLRAAGARYVASQEGALERTFDILHPYLIGE